MPTSPQRTLVTGACGFAGSHLVELLATRYRSPIDGTHRPDCEPVPPVLRERLRAHPLDITDAVACRDLLQELRPTQLFHLAGPAHVGESFGHAAEFAQSIFVGTINLLGAAAALETPPRVLLVSSSEVYGEAANLVDPLTEETPPLPNNPYGVAKLAAETYAQYLSRSGRLPVVISRSFNHFGPRQNPSFASASFAKQLVEAERGSGPRQIHVGNLSAARDMLDVRDVVAGYAMLVEKGQPGEVYNLASGSAISMSEVLKALIALAQVPVEVVHDTSRDRPADVATRRGSAARAEALGWKRAYPFERTLADLLAYWREAIPAISGAGG